MENFSKIIFIVGCPRAGTTLLQKLLLNIRGGFSSPETQFFSNLPDNYYVAPLSLPPFRNFKYQEFITIKTLKRVIRAMESYSNLKLAVVEKDMLEKKAVLKQLKTEELFRTVMGFYAHSDSSILIEKTPGHLFHVPFIRSIFPESAIIAIVRDPRDTFVSFNKMTRLQQKEKRSVAEFAFLWNKSVECILKNNLDVIKYENLLADPITQINKILRKHGLQIEQIDNSASCAIVKPNEIWKENIGRGIIKNNYGKYKNELHADEIAELENLCLEGMKKFGYETGKHGRKASMIFSANDKLKWYLRKIYIFRLIIFNKFNSRKI